jgi:phosphoheptose isomerase
MAADGDPGEVLFEFTAIGRSMKVVAIHAATGTEVTVVAPANAARADLQRLALQKLLAKMRSGG